MQDKSSYEGLQKNIRKLRMQEVKVWENQYPDKDYLITIEEPEFTCICPKTGLPDFAHIQIIYRPTKWCIELKSFKYYIYAYRDVGIFHEHVVNKMLEDLVRTCKPKWMQITAKFNVRGGIASSVQAEYDR